MINIGVLGTGRIGKIHIKNLLNHTKINLKAIVDPHADKEFINSINIPCYEDKKAIFEDDNIQGVFICTPSNTHYELIKEAITANKAVFCEKPVDLDMKRILEIKNLVEQKNAFLQVGFNRRFDSNFKRIADLVKEGEVGALIHTQIISRDFMPPPRAYIEGSGGMFMDMSIHDFDMLSFLTQKEVETVFVSGASLVSDYKDIDIDTALISLSLSDGSLASIHNCREAVYGYDQRVEVFGRKGRVFCENKYDNSVSLCNATNQSRQNALDFFLERYLQSYANELDSFVQSLNDKSKAVVGIDESIKATLIALGANESLKTKQTVELKKIKNSFGI